jgi:hypothetical protein
MKNVIAAGLFLVTSACASSNGSSSFDGGTSTGAEGADGGKAADAAETPLPNGVRVDFFGDGGVKYTVSRPALMEVDNAADAGFVGDDYVLPRDNHSRHGCFVETPWIPIPRGAQTAQAIAATVQAFPHLKIEWWGEVRSPADMTEQPVMEFNMMTQAGDGTTRADEWSPVDTGFLVLEPQSAVDGGGTAYHGVFENPASNGTDKPFGYANVASGAKVRFRLCNAFPGVKVTLHDVTFESVPLPAGEGR